MARFRTIDPLMWESPDLDGLTPLARLVLVALISHADDDGRMIADDTAIRLSVFPRGLPRGVTERTLRDAVASLTDRPVPLVTIYAAVYGRTYAAMPGWADGASWQYQRVDKRKDSRYPPPPSGVTRTARKAGRRPDDLVPEVSPPPAGSIAQGGATNRRLIAAEWSGVEAKGAESEATRPEQTSSSVGAALADAATPSLRGSELTEKLKQHEATISPNLRQTLEVGIEAMRSHTPEGEALARIILTQIENESARTAAVRNGAAKVLVAMGGKK